jgi:hypothetical protein
MSDSACAAQGTLANGTQFDSSRGRQPFSFEVGKHQVLPGVEYGVIGMWCAPAPWAAQCEGGPAAAR